MATDNVQWTFWGWGGQPMDVIFSIFVAPIDELEIASRIVDVIKGG